MTPVFHAAETPLTRGGTLIEASAGTGKTYTITAIFLRLLLEEGLDVSQILVTTYTEAATAELRDRIRARLTSAVEGFESGTSKDPLIQQLCTRIDRETAIPIIERAVRDFDQAAIHTIHGFCQRMLRDRALESGLPFDAELITDQRPILQEIVDDFWRTEFGAATAIVGSVCNHAKVTREKLLELLGQVVNRPLMVVVPNQIPGALQQFKAELDQLHLELRDHWLTDQAQIRSKLTGPPKWARGTYSIGKETTLSHWLNRLAECLSQDGGSVEDFLILSNLCTTALKKACLASTTPPTHPFFDACERYRNLCESFGTVVKLAFLEWAVAELRKRKERQNVLSFDDLLTRLYTALQGNGGPTLAKAMRSRFHAALIDEFQDTDPVQESIFRQVFGTGESYLYLIGDPKQAIYGFRGADIFSYLRAAGSAQHSYTLRTNRRSTTKLVHAVNHVFSRATAPFVFPEITFTEVEAAGDRDASPLQRDGQQSPPLKIWTYDSADPVQSGVASRELPALTADAISRVLGSNAQIGSREVQPSDIAVLVSQHWQARAIQDSLRELNIPSVLLSDESVWHTDDAFEMHVLLAAVAEPTREDKVRAAFSTEIMGGSVASLDKLLCSEPDWQEALLRFGRYHERWLAFGFIQMFRALLLGEHVRSRLLKLPDGDRRLTNVMHISELLQRESAERQLGPTALLRWLETQRSAERIAKDDDAILRLERDDDAVQVITMHRSKGLEFEIVFCPFAWGKAPGKSKDAPVVFHDPANANRLTMDLGSSNKESHQQILARERLAEEARLLYVALTRAIHECHFVWGRFAACPVSAAALLLHEPAGSGELVDRLKTHMTGLTAGQFASDLAELQETSDHCIDIAPFTTESGIRYTPAENHEPRETAARPFRHRIDRTWGVSSFSSIVLGSSAEQRDRDPIALTEAAAEHAADPTSIHAFPGGTRSGVCLHAILEAVDFTRPDEFAEIVRQKLTEFSFDPDLWTPAVLQTIEQTVAVATGMGFRLGDISREARLTELEFHLPVARLNAASLAEVLGDDAANLDFVERKGWLKGFIDLVFEHNGRFYIVDWKSNRLGADGSAYTPDAIGVTMVEHHYRLQALLYLVALHRYLAARIADYSYDTHCGGALYYFVRGCDVRQPGAGVHVFRPNAATIKALNSWLHGEE